jgi:phosphoenolpyruvate carboxykinase (GTP)
VAIDAFMFGGRRSTTVPLVTEARTWTEGVYMAATMGSETTAAAVGQMGVVRRDPFAMLPFCGYHMGDYFGHWLKIGDNAPDKNKLPKLFNVNWFRKNSEGKFLWPGYGDNVRVLKWVFERTEGADIANETAIGFVPKEGTIDVSGLNEGAKNIPELIKVDKNEWLAELELINEHYAAFGDRLPAEMKKQHEGLAARLNKAK